MDIQFQTYWERDLWLNWFKELENESIENKTDHADKKFKEYLKRTPDTLRIHRDDDY